MRKRFKRLRLSRPLLLVLGCSAALAGLGLAHFGLGLRPGLVWLLAGLVLVIVGRQRLLGAVGLIVLGLALGGLRGDFIMQQLSRYDGLTNSAVQLQVTANEDAVYGKHSQITFVAVNLRDRVGGRSLPGKIQVSGFGENAVYQGDVLLVSGKLRPGIGAYQGFMSYAQLQLISRYPSPVAALRRQFAAGMQTALPEPLASFCMGLLIGQRATLPDSVKQDLLMVGLTHVIAVSGYNLTIMLDASRRLLGNQSKRLSTGLSFGLMVFFVVLAGASASIIRAAVVSGLSLILGYFGRQPRPLLLIMLAASGTALQNPLYIWGDTSWYLSFLAFFGVMLVSPQLQARLPGKLTQSTFVAVGLESICAEIMTLPFILLTFGQLSLVGLPANMLVVALVPLAMLLGSLAGLAGMLVPAAAGLVAWPAKLLLTYMLDASHLLASLPRIFRQNVWFSLRQMLAWYSALAVLTWLLWFKSRPKSVILTDKKGHPG